MKVVFLQDVSTKDRLGEVKEVPDGYARNYLIPKRLASPATTGAVKQAETRKQALANIQARSDAEIAELAASIEGKEVILKAKAGPQGRLYGSITSANIAEGLKQSAGLEFDKKTIVLSSPIRALGSYEASIYITAGVAPKIKVTVEGE